MCVCIYIYIYIYIHTAFPLSETGRWLFAEERAVRDIMCRATFVGAMEVLPTSPNEEPDFKSHPPASQKFPALKVFDFDAASRDFYLNVDIQTRDTSTLK